MGSCAASECRKLFILPLYFRVDYLINLGITFPIFILTCNRTSDLITGSEIPSLYVLGSNPSITIGCYMMDVPEEAEATEQC